MEKVGVITFHRAENYGAVLQTYALCKTLRELGNESEVIDYRAKAIEREYRLFRAAGENLSERMEFLCRCVGYFAAAWRRKKRFRRFVRKYIPLSKPMTVKTIPNLSCEYHALISGSDQVFNSRITKEDMSNYLLAFAPEGIKRYSYAASFGYHVDRHAEVEAEIFRRELSEFSGLSVREYSGMEKIQRLIGRSAQMHIDPTLLLSKAEWEELCSTPRKRPYILMYLMHNATGAYHYAHELSEQMGLPVICIPGGPSTVEKVRFSGLHFVRDASPEDFLALFCGASYVITTSFHGTAFAILFQKPFVSFPSKKYKNDDRITSLLKLVGLDHRLFSPGYKDGDPINWDDVELRLNREREKAWEYLSSITEKKSRGQ